MRALALRLLQLSALLVGFGLRVWRLDFQELRGDEVFGYLFSLRPWDDIVRATIELQEPHPVASYYALKGWLLSAGESEFALRFAGVWFSVLAIALLYRLGRTLRLDILVATTAMGLLALSPYAIWHAQDARMYSMSLALTTASSWLAVAWLYARGRQRWLPALAYIIVSWLALHTHYFAAFVLVAQYLFMLGTGIWQRAWRTVVLPWLLIQGAVALLYLPWLVQAAATLTSYGGNGDSPGFGAMAQRALSVFAAGESVPPAQRTALAIIAGLLLLIGSVRLLRGARGEATAFLLLYLLVPVGATWLSALQRPIFDERYLVAALPPFFLLIGAIFQPPAVERTRRAYPALRLTSYALLAGLILVGLLSLNRYYTDPAYSKTRGWRELATALEALSVDLPAEQVRIAQNFPDPTLWYYYNGPLEHAVLPPGPLDADGAMRAVAELQAAGVRRVLLPAQPAPNWDDADLARTALAERYELLVERQVASWPVAIYARAPGEMTETDATWQNGLRLTAAAIEPPTLTPGNALAVWLQWDQRTADLSGTEKVFVQLLGPAGSVVAQDDQLLEVAMPDSPQLHGLALPAELSPGSYRLITGLYDPAIDGAPRTLTTTSDDHIVLHEWAVDSIQE